MLHFVIQFYRQKCWCVCCQFIVIANKSHETHIFRFWSRENRFYGIFFKSIHFFVSLSLDGNKHKSPIWEVVFCYYFRFELKTLKSFTNCRRSIYWIIGILLAHKKINSKNKHAQACRIETVQKNLVLFDSSMHRENAKQSHKYRIVLLLIARRKAKCIKAVNGKWAKPKSLKRKRRTLSLKWEEKNT